MRCRRNAKTWSLALGFLFVLLSAGTPCANELPFRAKRIPGPLPLDPYHESWKQAPVVQIELIPQSITTPSIFEAKIQKLYARALHNGEEIAFLLEWDDETRDVVADIDRYSDAAAVMFPSHETPGEEVVAPFTMGDGENPVNIWFWKASWQEKVEAPRIYYAPDPLRRPLRPEKGETEGFRGGVLAGNPVSGPRRTPVANAIAWGFGTLTELHPEKTEFPIDGLGKWQAKRWAVTVKRSLAGHSELEAGFKAGEASHIAFAVWNGSENQRGARKVFSIWYDLTVEK